MLLLLGHGEGGHGEGGRGEEGLSFGLGSSPGHAASGGTPVSGGFAIAFILIFVVIAIIRQFLK